MLTWAYVWYMVKSNSHSQLGHWIPMFCDTMIFYFIARAFMRSIG